MNVRRIARDAKETVRQETDERVKAARLLVMRDVVIAVVVAAIIMVYVAVSSDPHYLGVVFTFPFLAVGVGCVAMISSRRHKSTTPEMDRARTVQMVLAIPGTVIVAALLVWAIEGDLGGAIEVGVFGGLGVGVATALTFWKSRRG